MREAWALFSPDCNLTLIAISPCDVTLRWAPVPLGYTSARNLFTDLRGSGKQKTPTIANHLGCSHPLTHANAKLRRLSALQRL